MPDDGQQLNNNCFPILDPIAIWIEKKSMLQGMGVIAPSSEIWGKFLYSKYRTTGGSGGGGGGVGDWYQRLCIMETMHSAINL